MKLSKKLSSAIVVGIFAILTAMYPMAASSNDADATVQKRQAVMKDVRSTAVALTKAIKGGASNDELVAAANAFVAATNAEMAIAAFEPNTHGISTVKTTATEKVWTDWDRFSQALTDLEAGAKEIQAAAVAGNLNSEDQLGVAMKECGFCHRQAGYRSR